MQQLRRQFLSAVFALCAALTAAAPVAAQVAGRDFTPVSPAQPTEDPAKIEMLVFFSFGCPHCADFDPLLAAWAGKQASDVVVRKVPVTFGRAAWANGARLFYALEATGDLKRLEGQVFRAIHGERANLFDERTMIDWVVARGVDRKKFTDALGSFGVRSRVARGDQLAQAYRISGVPAVALEGKYLLSANSFGELLAVADKMVAKARAEKAARK